VCIRKNYARLASRPQRRHDIRDVIIKSLSYHAVLAGADDGMDGLKGQLFWIRLRKLKAIASHSFYRKAFLSHRVAPAIEHESVLRGLGLDFVVDVGANRGQFSLVCRRLFPEAAIVGFEPQDGAAGVYRALFANDTRVRLHESALAAERGQMMMHISARDDSSSLLPISGAQTGYFPGTEAVGTRMVAVGFLQDFVQPSEFGKRAFLKVDVQGFELEVLKAAEPLLASFGWIYVECSFVQLYEGQPLAPEILAWLEERNFAVAGNFNPTTARDGTRLQADLLFRNRKSG
jgi:FkbM family methyltransferase